MSRPPYDSLNMAGHVGDQPEAVSENRRRTCLALGLKPDRLITVNQTHGANVVSIDAEARRDPGRNGCEPAADAIVTGETGVPIAVMTADCVPIIIVHKKSRSVAVVHAGYKGLYLNIVAASIDRMVKEASGGPADMAAFIGPAIGPCCYEVDEDRAKMFESSQRRVKQGNYFLDLPGIAEDMLAQAGIRETMIMNSGICTACREDMFYSYRRDGVCGRQAAIAAVL